MKQFKLVFALTLAISLLTGCATEIIPSEISTEQYTETQRPAVVELHCTTPSALSAIYPAGGAKAIICWTDYEAEVTTLQIVDTANDTVCNETTLHGAWDFKTQTFSDGRWALCNRDSCQWKFLDTSLREIGTAETETVDGYFDRSGDKFYFLRDHVLCYQDISSGAISKVPLSIDLRFLEITAFDAQAGQMVLQFYLSTYSSECGTAIVDVTTGQLSMLQAERYQAVFAGDTLCLLYFDMNSMGYSVSYGWDDGDCLFADAGIFADRSSELYSVSGTSYLMGVATDTTIYGIGEQIKACSLPDYGISGEMYSVCYLPDTELLVGGVYQDGGFQLYVIDPMQLSFTEVADATHISSPFTVNSELARAYWEETAGAPVAETLQEARDYADRLENKYGVRILLSDQCKEAAALCEYPIALTDTLGAEELSSILTALERLNCALALYPDGFLAQFRNSMEEGGLRFLLVEEINSGFGTIGCTFENGNWQNIALDVRSSYALDGIICHEIWHATENHILSQNYTAFPIEDWTVLNPQGFTYTYDATLIDSERMGWTLYGGSLENVYFVDSYAQVDEREDRARIMEYFMVHTDEAELLIQSPAIRQKLQRMCNAIRSNFDTNGWDSVRWEELL